MKFLIPSLLPLFLVISVLPVLPLGAQNSRTPAGRDEGPRRVNAIAAKVNGEVITLNELMTRVAPQQAAIIENYKATHPRAPASAALKRELEEVKFAILDEPIDRAIIYSEFKDRIGRIPDQQIEQEVKRTIQNVYQGDEDLFREYLRRANTTLDQFKQNQRREFLVQAVKGQHLGDVPAPFESELREEYERWKIENRDRDKDVVSYRRIYLRKDRGGGPQAQRILAQRLVEKLKNGGDFASLARRHSDDTHADEGGLWEDIPRSDRKENFFDFLLQSEGDGVMGPRDNGFGYDIIQVTKRKLGPAKPYEEVREVLKRRVVNKKQNANLERWLKKMRSRAEIEIML